LTLGRRGLPRAAVLAVLGIVLVALNLRTAVTSLAPIAPDIAIDIPLSNVSLSVLGSIAPLAFAISALLSPRAARKLGLELLLALAIGLMITGHLLRAMAPSYLVLLAGSVVALSGMGVANVLLPPLVKRFFPDRIGLMTTLYVMLSSLSGALPALVAVPVAQMTDWRVSLAIWSVLAVLGLLPWLAILQQQSSVGLVQPTSDAFVTHDSLVPLGRPIWQSSVAWSLAAVFGVACLNAYAMMTWLPDILAQTNGTSSVESGAMLAVYAAMGLPPALILPMLAMRVKNVGSLVHVGVVFLIAGYLGILLAPSFATWFWVVLVGLGPLPVTVCLMLINLRTLTMSGAVALSGFVQGVGYTIAALGPLLVGVLREATGGWIAVFTVLIVSALVVSTLGVLLRKTIFVEDQLQPTRP
jgi:CP family cyanate transporter-like MFS transporter